MQAWQQIQLEYSSHTNFSQGWQVGGDAYTAVAVAKKTGTGSWVVYNIFRDHLGTITHLKNGSTIDEYSFDAWGRRRDKDNWNYTLSGEPALFADRGFTGHEFLADFNLYNMPARLSHFHLNYFSDGQAGGNGRLYDPVVGRFLSPDPYIADPSFTQSYNRYSYVLNNPLKYNDPTGELPGWALGGIATAGNWLFGGMDNWINKGMSFKQSFSTAYNPIVFSANYHPGNNSWSNTQVNAHRLVGAMANAERGVHSNIAGFSGMGRYGEGPLFTSTPLPQFVGESPLANLGIPIDGITELHIAFAQTLNRLANADAELALARDIFDNNWETRNSPYKIDIHNREIFGLLANRTTNLSAYGKQNITISGINFKVSGNRNAIVVSHNYGLYSDHTAAGRGNMYGIELFNYQKQQIGWVGFPNKKVADHYYNVYYISRYQKYYQGWYNRYNIVR
jgi:RHS repeat-associated protein